VDDDEKPPRGFWVFVHAATAVCVLGLIGAVAYLATGAVLGLKSSLLAVLTVAFFLTASITTFDKRLTQAKKRGELPSDEPSLPRWVALLYWIEIGLKVALFVVDWRYGLLVYIVGFVLSVLPVLETVGNFLTAPFKHRPVSELRRLAEEFLAENPNVAQAAWSGMEKGAQLTECENLVNHICEKWGIEDYRMSRDDVWEARRRIVEQLAAAEANPAQRELLLALGGHLIAWMRQ